MDDSFRVSGVECPTNLLDDGYGLRRSDLPLSSEKRAQILSLDVLHGDELQAVGFAQVVNANDILMGYMASEDEFLLESLQDARIAGQFRPDHFQCDDTFEFEVPGLVDRTHPAFPQHADDSVAVSDHGTRQKYDGSTRALKACGCGGRFGTGREWSRERQGRGVGSRDRGLSPCGNTSG